MLSSGHGLSPVAVRAWPLVGRRAELEALTVSLAGGTPGVVLAGAAGVGKTRLAREVMDQAAAKGWATEWVGATRAAASIPLGAFASLLPVLDVGGGNRLRLLQGASRALVERAAGRPLLVGVDDAHLLDDASAALVHQLAVTTSAHVLVTVRTGETAPDPILTLWKDGLAERVELQALSESEVGELVSSVLSGQVEGLTLSRLWKATAGNALSLRELVLSGIESGALAQSGEVWTWTGPLTVSGRLLELVDARLARLDAGERAVVEVLAVGEPVGARVLETMVPADSLESVERRGLVSAERDGRRVLLRLAHPLYAEVLRHRLPELRVREIHRRLTSALERAGARRRDDLLVVATGHLETAEGGSPALLTAAARRAQGTCEPALAERLARAAVESGGGLPARLVLAESLTAQGRVAEVEGVLAAGEAVPENDGHRALVAERRALALCWGLGRPADAEQVLTDSEAAIVDERCRDELQALQATVMVFSGRPQPGLVVAEDVLTRMGNGPRALSRAAVAAVAALAVAGRTDTALQTARRFEEAARTAAEENPLAPHQLQSLASIALRLAGHLSEADALAVEGYRQAVAQGWRDAAHLWAGALGEGALWAGRIGTARRWLREAVALGQGPSGLAQSACLARLAEAEALAGDLEASRAAVAGAEAARNPAMALFAPLLDLGRAWLSAATGERSRACDLAFETAETAEAGGSPALAVTAFLDVARLGGAPLAAPRLERLAAGVEGPFAPAAAAYAGALAARDGPALDGASTAFEAMGALLLAAEAGAAAAAVHRQAGRQAGAAAAGARAAWLLERCEGARSPAVMAFEAPRLTPRELEVATLASDGISSSDIAARLYLSVRTVDSHLAHAYTKLGVNSRRELGAVLGRAAPRVDPEYQ